MTLSNFYNSTNYQQLQNRQDELRDEVKDFCTIELRKLGKYTASYTKDGARMNALVKLLNKAFNYNINYETLTQINPISKKLQIELFNNLIGKEIIK